MSAEEVSAFLELTETFNGTVLKRFSVNENGVMLLLS